MQYHNTTQCTVLSTPRDKMYKDFNVWERRVRECTRPKPAGRKHPTLGGGFVAKGKEDVGLSRIPFVLCGRVPVVVWQPADGVIGNPMRYREIQPRTRMPCHVLVLIRHLRPEARCPWGPDSPKERGIASCGFGCTNLSFIPFVHTDRQPLRIPTSNQTCVILACDARQHESQARLHPTHNVVATARWRSGTSVALPSGPTA